MQIGKTILYYIDHYPVQAISLGLGFFGFTPIILVPLKESLGFKTNQINKKALESKVDRWLRLRKTV